MRTYHPCLLVLTALLTTTLAEQSCFYPDGKNATGLKPCKNDGSVSHCCREADVCLTNGLCFSSGLGSVLRRACTDKSWNSQDCPNFCTSEPFKSAEAVLTSCGPYNTFCCGQDANARECCNTGNSSLTVKIAGGEAMCTKTPTIAASASAAPTSTAAVATSTAAYSIAQSCSKSMETGRNALIGVTAAFGVLIFAIAGLAIMWRKGMKNEEKAKLIKENENQALIHETAKLKGDYDWLYQQSPAPIRREMDAKKKARVTTTETTSP